MSALTRRLFAVGVLLVLTGFGVYYYLGRTPQSLKIAQAAVAQRDFTTALQAIQPDFDAGRANPETLLLGARTARRAGQQALADRYLRQYQDRGGDAEIIAIERILGGIQRGELGGFDGGIQFCVKNPTHPQTPYVLEAMTEGYVKTGNIVKAIDTATRWLAASPLPADGAQAHILRGTCYRNIGSNEVALADYEDALKLTPDSPEAQTLVGELLVSKDPERASQYFQAALKTDPKRADARLGLARSYRNRSQAEQAKAELDRVLVDHPNHIATLIERAKLAVDQRDFNAAEQDLRNVLTTHPRSLDANTTLARVLELMGRTKESAKIRDEVKAFEAELFRKIDELVKSGMIPPPSPGNEIPKQASP